jgi:hypothetical protein
VVAVVPPNFLAGSKTEEEAPDCLLQTSGI